MRIVAVTACPTGVALTYMAANRLSAAARRLGYAMKIETQGALGSEDLVTRKDVARADVAILAADVAIEQPERFEVLPTLKVSTAEAIDDPDTVLGRALALIGGEVPPVP
jgi:fructose-specific phosphotransferase system IIB component